MGNTLDNNLVSRQAVLEIIEKEPFKGDAISEIEKLPSVTPKEKTGHWIPYIPDYDTEIEYYVCSECKNKCMSKTRYCYDCGCHMVEPQESENKEAQDGNS